jgi:hypothetical protein
MVVIDEYAKDLLKNINYDLLNDLDGIISLLISSMNLSNVSEVCITKNLKPKIVIGDFNLKRNENELIMKCLPTMENFSFTIDCRDEYNDYDILSIGNDRMIKRFQYIETDNGFTLKLVEFVINNKFIQYDIYFYDFGYKIDIYFGDKVFSFDIQSKDNMLDIQKFVMSVNKCKNVNLECILEKIHNMLDSLSNGSRYRILADEYSDFKLINRINYNSNSGIKTKELIKK